MAKQDNIRAQLQSKVFDAFGKSVTIKTPTITYDAWGSEASRTEASTTTVGVDYDIVYSRKNYEKFGDLNEGEREIVLPYDTVITTDDKITINSEDFIVKQIEKPSLPDVVVVIVRLVPYVS